MAPQKPEPRDSSPETQKHKAKVLEYLRNITSLLMTRAWRHDDSKLESPEKELFDEWQGAQAECEYASDEYYEIMQELRRALDHHYRQNRHHPEHFPRSVRDMTLVDIVEMFCDWCAASERHLDGDIHQSIEVNRSRFGIDRTLACIFANTARELDMGKNSQKRSESEGRDYDVSDRGEKQ